MSGGRNLTPNKRESRKRADTTPTKGSSNDEDIVQRRSPVGKALAQEDKSGMFSSQILMGKLEQINKKFIKTKPNNGSAVQT